MTYGIYVTKENFDVFEDGSKKRTSISQGWYKDAYYNSMKSAKNSLAMAKDSLNEDFYAVPRLIALLLRVYVKVTMAESVLHLQNLRNV